MKWVGAFVLAAWAAVAAGASDDAVPPVPGFRYEAGRYLPDEPWRAGQPRMTGLQHPFPAMVTLEENPVTPERVTLGKLLYFDPILSGDNTLSCAHCHHPDFGFSDGRKTSMGVGGVGVGPERTGGERLPRAAPTIWNAAYNHMQFWDGRAADLEEQADKPITSNIEMDQNPEELVRELRTIPEYVSLFDDAFDPLGVETVTYENVLQAIGAFERTLLSFNSPFDRYTQGDSQALTDEEKRGLALFRSVKTRCFECHRIPTFADAAFRVIGVPNSRHDPGRAGVPGQGPDGGFKVPTLRNIALTAPYMHNGAFDTLEEVIQFYADGAGRADANPVPGIDDKIHKFPMTDREVSDLTAFLRALTDTSLQPDAPARVPSGLPVVAVESRAMPAPPPVQIARAEDEHDTGAVNETEQTRIRPDVRGAFERRDAVAPAAAVFTVSPGELIQAAIDRAQPGDRIEVRPGLYHESLVLDTANVMLVGLHENGARAILDGQGMLNDAVQASGDNFTIEGFEIRNYQSNGVMASRVNGATFRDLVIHNTGLYGVYPVECRGVTVERCVVSGASDAGIYIGQSRDVVVRDSEVYRNVAGIEIENCVDALVQNNSAHLNTVGILVVLMPNAPVKEAHGCRVYGNRVWANNHTNFAPEGVVAHGLAPGVGVMVVAADSTEIAHNRIEQNGAYGVAVLGLPSADLSDGAADAQYLDPNPDDTWLHDNTYAENGAAVGDAFAKKYPAWPGGDILWDGAGERNQFQESIELKTTPDDLIQEQGGVHTEVIHFL